MTDHSRPDSYTLHLAARRERARAIGDFIARLLRLRKIGSDPISRPGPFSFPARR